MDANQRHWVLTTLDDKCAAGTLNECLEMAGFTTKEAFYKKYLDEAEKPGKDRDLVFAVMALESQHMNFSESRHKALFEKASLYGLLQLNTGTIQYNPDRAKECL